MVSIPIFDGHAHNIVQPNTVSGLCTITRFTLLKGFPFRAAFTETDDKAYIQKHVDSV